MSSILLQANTSGFVTIATNQTITGEKTFAANTLFDGATRVYIGTGESSYFTEATSGGLPGFDYIQPTGGIFRVTTASVFGTDDLFFQGIPPTGGAFGFESGNNADFYIGPGNSNRALRLTTARVTRVTISDQGVQFNSGSIAVPVGTSAGSQSLAVGSAFYQEYTGTGGHTWTLPLRASLVGLTFRIKNIGSGADLVVSRAGADQLFTTSAVNTVNVPVGTSIDVTAGNSFWNVS